jgi:hypothetical protein
MPEEEPLTPLEQDVADNGGWAHFKTNMAHVGAYTSMETQLNQEKGYPKSKTVRAIRLREDATQGTHGGYLLACTTRFIKDKGDVFQRVVVDDNKWTQITKVEYETLKIPN